MQLPMKLPEFAIQIKNYPYLPLAEILPGVQTGFLMKKIHLKHPIRY